MLFIKQSAIGPWSGVLNKMICIFEAQSAAELREVKFEGPKKLLLASGGAGLT